jgi:hypothetical protein
MLPESEGTMADQSIRLAEIAIGAARAAHADLHGKTRFALAQSFLAKAIAQRDERNMILAQFYAERAKSQAEHALAAARNLESGTGLTFR